MNGKAICLNLLNAESERAVQEIIDSVEEMKEPNNWTAIDNRESNFNIVTNQASTGGKAATELMTNMVDAILTKCAIQKGIDPKNRDQAPENMYEAVDRLVINLRGGKLVNADKIWLKDYSLKNLIIGISGSQDSTRISEDWPCYTFVDNGEGQHPNDFQNTFLSLSARNKSDIPFVQGKYNMGSSGVLAYCGTKWFKLIVSRRFDSTGSWGWTIIRRRPEKGVPIAEYFHINGIIPSFQTDSLYPLCKNDGDQYDGVMLKTGTVVKLYDFRVGRKFKSFRGAREAFNENLIETILPFRLMDFRWAPSSKRGGDRAHGIDARPFYGMEYILRRSADDGDENASIADKIQVGTIDNPELGQIDITAITFPLRQDNKDPLPGWLKPNRSNFRVFHTVNGQVQYKQTRGFLSSCGYSGIKDRIVVLVDASRLNEETQFNLWKGDRENIIQNATGERYLALINEAIKSSPSLDDWKQQVAREDFKRISTKDTNDLFQKLVESDSDLIDLLDHRDPTIKLPNTKVDEKQFEGKFDPTFLEFSRNYNIDPLEIPLNKPRAFKAATDAVNEFFTRPDNKGRLFISNSLVRERFAVRHILYNGRLTVFLELVGNGSMAGEIYNFDLGLHSDSMPIPVTRPVSVKILSAEDGKIKPPKPTPRPRPLPNVNEDLKRALPKYVLLTKDGREVLGQTTAIWPEGFTELDGGRITGEDENPIYEINVDNVYHLKYRLRARSETAKDLLSQKYVTGMRLFLLGFENSRINVLKALKEGENVEVFNDMVDEFRGIAARAAASVVLWLTDQLPKIIDLPEETVE